MMTGMFPGDLLAVMILIGTVTATGEVRNPRLPGVSLIP
jgi:hypothetical protein